MRTGESKKSAEIVDPLTGELVGGDDFERLQQLQRQLSDAEWEIRVAKRRIERAFAAGEHPTAMGPDPGASTAQKLALRRLRERLGLDEWEWRRLLATYRAESSHQLRHEEAVRLLAHLRDRFMAG